ncbi:hypothetical protein HYU06_07230 [Candidatus Woesearchaeota archaeon]|nr:hypothetical protein [Candidatus Woesearchaeota archaeon]
MRKKHLKPSHTKIKNNVLLYLIFIWLAVLLTNLYSSFPTGFFVKDVGIVTFNVVQKETLPPPFPSGGDYIAPVEPLQVEPLQPLAPLPQPVPEPPKPQPPKPEFKPPQTEQPVSIKPASVPELISIPKEITKEDLKKIDLKDIGITPADVDTNKVQITEIPVNEITQKVMPESPEKIIELITEPAKADIKPEVIEKIKPIVEKFSHPDVVKPMVEKSLKVYEVKNIETGKAISLAKAVISIVGSEEMKDISIIEVIPKTVAQSTDELTFSEQPLIIQSDPIVQWNINQLPAGQKKEVFYIVKKKIESLESVTVAVGLKKEKEIIEEKPGILEEKLQLLQNKTALGLFLIALTLLVLIIIYAVKYLSHKGKNKTQNKMKKSAGNKK